MNAEEEWTARRSRGTTTAPQQSHPPHSVDSDAGSTLTGLECLSADLCRSLGGVSARPSALSDAPTTMVWWRKMLACGNPDEDRVYGIPLPALWAGEARGGDEL